MFKICVYVPENSVEKVKQALFDAGAGHIGNYDCCCWQTTGTGQFRPLAGSQPTIGSRHKLEQVKEIKIELVCEQPFLQASIAAMKRSHPYETPAYDVWKLENF